MIWRRIAVAGIVLGASFLSGRPVFAETTECRGYPNHGTLEHPMRLRPRRYLQIRHKSRSRVWAHPALLQMLDRGAKTVAGGFSGSVLAIGDLSTQGGGPLSGHVSHQVGRDADVGFWVTNSDGIMLAKARFSPFDAKGRGKADKNLRFDLRRNWVMLRAWIDYLRVPIRAIFLSAGLRQRMLQYGSKEASLVAYVPLAKRLLKRHAKHDDHFHLRIGCPPDQQTNCREDSRPR